MLGHEHWKCLHKAHVFSVFSIIHEVMWPVRSLPPTYMGQSGASGPLIQFQVHQNRGIQTLKLCQREIPTSCQWLSFQKKLKRAQQHISTCASPLAGSVPQKMTKWLHRVSDPTGFEPMLFAILVHD